MQLNGARQKTAMHTTFIKLIWSPQLGSIHESLWFMQEKEEIEIGKFRQTLCFKARPLPDFYKERKSQKSEIDKVCLSSCAAMLLR